MKTRKLENVFVDTNIIIGAFLCEWKAESECLKYLFSLNKSRLFISSLTIIQFISVAQKRKFDRTWIVKTVGYLCQKFNILNCVENDIELGMKLKNFDIEDNIQFIIGKKKKCYYYVTKNKNDFNFLNISVVPPNEYRKILNK